MFVITLSEAISMGMVGLLLFAYLIAYVCTRIKQFQCKHSSYKENSQCHAICRNCGMDLGFIGSVRERGENDG